MVNPKVSIIVPLYNKEKYIIQTLRSVSSQTYLDWECIIVDDGSNDSSVSLVKNFLGGSSHNFILLTSKNMGQSVARNLGLDAARGKYIAFLDGDDLWMPNKLELQVKILETDNEVSMVLGGYAILEKKRLSRVVIHRNVKTLKQGWINFQGFGGALESVALIRASVLKENKFDKNLSTSAGLDLFIRLSEKYEVSLLADILMGYLKYDGQWHRGFVTLTKDIGYLSKRNPEKIASQMLVGLKHYESLILFKSSARKLFLSKESFLLPNRISFSFIKFALIYICRQILSILGALFKRRQIKILRRNFQ